MTGDASLEELAFGTTVYDGDGRELGKVRGIDESGFYVSVAEGLAGLSAEHVAPDGAFGEAELMWRCWNCGALGALSGEVPEECPDCDAQREDLYYWIED